ncbi:hypothetical protein [Altererythrobacter sp. MF3-039]|uniref:hypothetical protein n=1 Tax=Altererythrobacter sp. MF3-039 TaxID=3252901 RepID=UPI00390C5BE3
MSGTLRADIVQACAISDEEFAHVISEKLDLVFVPSGESSLGDTIPSSAEIEIELDTGELDEIEYDGESFDLGEAVSQSLGLAIDPYAEGPNADSVREAAGIIGDDEPSGPLAEALRSLKRD